MLLMLQFWYNLSFKGFGSRPVVYLSPMFGGSVETSIEEFCRFLWVFNRLVLLVDSIAPVVSRFMGDVSHFFQSTRTCISNANRLQVSSVYIDTNTTRAGKQHSSKQEHNQQGTFKLFHIDSTKQKHMYMMLRFSFTLCSNIIINLLCLGVLMLIKISFTFNVITLLRQHGRQNVFVVVVIVWVKLSKVVSDKFINGEVVIAPKPNLLPRRDSKAGQKEYGLDAGANPSCSEFVACEQALCLEKKIAWKGKGKVGERACRQTFEAAIPPSCNYPADHLSVRSLSVNQFRAWVTPRKINRKWAVFCSVWKQSEMEHEPYCRFCKKSLISGKRIKRFCIFTKQIRF